MVALKNREYAMNNPKAQFKKPTSIEEIMSARMITDPLGLFDCSPATDGAAAIVLSKGENGVIEPTSAQASGTTQMQEAKDLISIPSIRESANLAYTMANLEPDDIDVVELHDCFTMTEVIAIEELGFFNKGTGWEAIEQGLTKHGGKIPVKAQAAGYFLKVILSGQPACSNLSNRLSTPWD